MLTTRDFKAASADPGSITIAGRELEIARQALLKAARHLATSDTRALHKDVVLLKDGADNLSIRLTEFAGE